MIDIHCHLLPGLDDGADTVEEALEIALQLSQAGFRKVIATPHVFEERNVIKPEEIIEATRSCEKIGKIIDVTERTSFYIYNIYFHCD